MELLDVSYGGSTSHGGASHLDPSVIPLSLYANKPTDTISMHEFETLGFDRLTSTFLPPFLLLLRQY